MWNHRHVRRLVLLIGIGMLACVAQPAMGATSRFQPLYANGVTDVRFGQSVTFVTQRLTRVFGAPFRARPVTLHQDCNVDSYLQFSTLNVYFRGGKFVGYAYATKADYGVRAPTRRRLTVARTIEGLEVGDTTAQASKIYPGRFKTSTLQNGTWSVVTSSGVIRGYLSVEATSRSPLARIATIEAGSLGCPALSP